MILYEKMNAETEKRVVNVLYIAVFAAGVTQQWWLIFLIVAGIVVWDRREKWMKPNNSKGSSRQTGPGFLNIETGGQENE